jgi:hypothetical protein
MKVLLVVLAGIVALFAGGCAVILGADAMRGSQAGFIAMLMLATATANIALIVGVLRARGWAVPFLWIFVAIDIVLAGILAVALGNDPYAGGFAIAAAAFLAVKGAAEGVAAHRIRQRQDMAS